MLAHKKIIAIATSASNEIRLLFFIAAAVIAWPRSVEDLTDGNTADLFAADSLMNTEPCFINAAKIFSGRILTQVFAGVAIKSPAAGAAAATLSFPARQLIILPLLVEVLVTAHGLTPKNSLKLVSG
jgi:hypothetical protein